MKTKLMKAAAAAMAMAMLCSCGAESKKETTNETPTITLFANFNPADIGESDAALIKRAEDALGIKVEFDIPPSTSYSERMQLMLASGEYPDAILFLDTTDQSYLNAIDQDILVPLNEYIDQAENIQKYSYKESWEALKSKGDDKIYGIPRSSMVRNDGYIIREDWLEKVGLQMPADHAMSADEFAEMLMSDDGWHGILYGTEGINYDMVDGKIVMRANVESPWKGYFVRRVADFNFFAHSSTMTDEQNARLKPIVQIGIDTNIFSLDMGYTPRIASQVSFINSQTSMDEAVTKIVTGVEPVSSYDSTLEQWYKNGGEEYVKDMNEHIKSNQK